MQRSSLTALASLGLIGLVGASSACKPADCPCDAESPNGEPDSNPANQESGLAEPSGRRATAKPVLELSTTDEPRFDTVPDQFCTATLQRRDQPLVRTASFLEAWNALAPPIRNPLAVNIPATEIDARIQLCSAVDCTIVADRVATVTADYMVGTGALLPIDGGLLVVPEIAAPHTNNPCSSISTIEVFRDPRFIHVRVSNEERRYAYSHHGHGGYGGGYGGYYPGNCTSYSVSRRDLIIDASSLELELVLDQSLATAPGGFVELAIESPGIVLRGCDSALELRWTE